jgi:hypothetical protein
VKPLSVNEVILLLSLPSFFGSLFATFVHHLEYNWVHKVVSLFVGLQLLRLVQFVTDDIALHHLLKLDALFFFLGLFLLFALFVFNDLLP